MEEEIVEIDCAKCENKRVKHKAVVLEKRETDNKEIIEFRCQDCSSEGILTRYKTSQIEILDYFPD